MTKQTNPFEFITLQQAFDYAVENIVKQGKQCKVVIPNESVSNKVFRCSYSDGRGNHCAVGWLAPDHFELGRFRSSVEDATYEFDDLPKIIYENRDAFTLLQEFHDMDTRVFRQQSLEEMQRDYGIDTSEPHWAAWVEISTARL